MASSPVESSNGFTQTQRNTKRMPFQEDDSPTTSPVKAVHTHAFPSNTQSSPQAGETHLFGSPNAEAADEESDEESEDEIRRPVGRAARRMLGGSSDAKLSSKPSHFPKRVQDVADDTDDELYTSTPVREAARAPSKDASPPASIARSALSVSPAKPQDESEDELPDKPLDSKSRLAELVAQKRAERLAKEAEERERHSAAHASSDLPDELLEDVNEPVNPEIERIMSDAAKPTRKASKRAMLEMERETQRLARQQALAHQTKVKKKFTTSDLFARFNYRPVGHTNVSPAAAEGDTTASSAPNSDAVERSKEPVSTPPSSPPTPLDRQRALVDHGALSKMMPAREDSLTDLAVFDDGEDLPDLAEILSSSRKEKAADITSPHLVAAGPEAAPKKGLKLARLGKKAIRPPQDESDDELEILKALPGHLSVFDKAKGVQRRQNTDSTAIHTLKHLSHIGADYATSGRRKKTNSRPSVNPQMLEVQLRMRAKEQARAQQLERIAELKAKGIEVQTSEERETEQEEFESLLEKARQDAVELREAEKAAAKENGDKAAASDDESDDEDYVDGSGSEAEDDGKTQKEGHELVDDLADESDEDEDELDEEADQDLGQDELQADAAQDGMGGVDGDVASLKNPTSPTVLQNPMVGRKSRVSRVIKDDDDESDLEPSQPVSNAVNFADDSEDDVTDDDPFAAFGFGAAKPGSSLMSPTQAFNATMQTPTQATQDESQDNLRRLVPPMSSSLPPVSPAIASQTQGDSQVSFVPGSQFPESQQIKLAWETQPPETPVPGLNRDSSHLSIETPGWEPTQDGGLPEMTPAGKRANTLQSIDAEDDTQSTVPLRISESPQPVPAVSRKRLVRGQRALSDSSDEEEAPAAFNRPDKKDAFREMARKRKEAMSAAELAEAEREARGMMDEQAEESEDEYAGLGGDDFVAPETEQDREMIDSSHVDVDERQLAAHFAERQRVADEAAANKLYKDLMTGGLRRKHANMFDLDDDEDDLAVRRRQMKQREEARKRKLLLQDDNIAGLAEGKQSKGKDAFLKAIADDDERDEDIMDLSDQDDDEGSTSTPVESQPSQPAQSEAAPLTEISGNKRRMEEEPEERPPAKQRRTKVSAFRAPTSLLEVKESVSFLLDEPHAMSVGPTVLDLSSDSEKEDDKEEEQSESEDDNAMQEELDRNNDGGFAPDRVAMPPPRLPASQRRTAAKPAVVDRLSMKRGSSASESAHNRTAWAAPANVGFKTPSLLRRATTNTTLSANERGVSTTTGLSRENSGGVKMGGSKKSSLAYQAREEERKAIVEAAARRRQESTAKIAQLRRAASSGGLGKGMGGRFE